MKQRKFKLRTLSGIMACLIMLSALPLSAQAAALSSIELKQYQTDITAAKMNLTGYMEELDEQGESESYSLEEGGYFSDAKTISDIDYVTQGSTFTISKAPGYTGKVRCFIETYVIDGDKLISVISNESIYFLALDSTKEVVALDGGGIIEEGWNNREITTTPASFDFGTLKHDMNHGWASGAASPIDMGQKDVIHCVYVFFSDSGDNEPFSYNTWYRFNLRVAGTDAETPSLTATPTSSEVFVNGPSTAFDAYTINDNNYFKLRDLAKILSGTEKQFEVTWDGAKNAINLASGKAYTPIGGEMTKGDGTAKNAQANQSAIYLDGEPVSLTAYTIGGNNYFKLRDIGKLFDFDVSWDGENNAIIVETAASYTED